MGLAGPLMLASLLTGLGPAAAAAAAASAATCGPGIGQPPSPGFQANAFKAVTVLPQCRAWAVGFQTSNSVTKPLIEKWNGTVWKVVPGPNLGGSDNFLSGVRAISANNIWAVGTSGNSTLTMHWNGTAWTVVPSRSPGRGAQLTAVNAVSAKDVWAVGHFTDSHGGHQTLIEHWNGTSWKVVPSPSPARPGFDNELTGVAATSKTNAWAVGYFDTTDKSHDATLTLHWNGTKWTRIPSPSPGASDQLSSVSATSARNAWAVGDSIGTTIQGLILHWNGTKWTRTLIPAPGLAVGLGGVAATSAGNAFAVGSTSPDGGFTSQVFVLHWTGGRWLPLQIPAPGTSGALGAVAATSVGNAWVVGSFSSLNFPSQALALHCC
jgi:hypothetical protein